MFYKKKGIPEENELVICTIKKILPHSVFVDLDEYENKEAMIHISEISPGRIRNIRDFVRENKVIVCKVLKINHEKGHIDLSLRRVSSALKRKKEDEHKQEQKSEKLIDLLTKQEKITMPDFYKTLGSKILEEFDSLTNFFNDVLINEKDIPKEFQDKLGKALIKLIKEKIKLPEVKLESIINLRSTESNGVALLKDTFKKTQEFADKQKFKIKLNYIGAPKYSLIVKASNYKEAEKILQEVSDYAVNYAKSHSFEGSWQKKS